MGANLELVRKQLMQLFPTCLFVGMISDLSACDRVEQKLRDLQRSGLGTFEPLTYITPDDIWKLDEMKEIVDLVMSESAKVLDFYRIKRESHGGEADVRERDDRFATSSHWRTQSI